MTLLDLLPRQLPQPEIWWIKKKNGKEIYHKEENVFHETHSNIVLSNEISLKAIVREIGLNQFKHTTTRQQNILDGTYQVKVNFYKYSDP